jgi:hypothetical protein
VTVLDEILEASTDSTVPVPDILRKVQIAATRLGATAIVDWARSELSGYGDDATLPSYRHTNANVMGLFTGPMQSQIRQQLTTRLTEMNHLWEVELRMPLVELQGLATAEGDPRREWTASDVRRYEESGVYRIYLHTLFTAWNILSKQNLLGIVDVVRTKAMEFALELQASFPEAGSVGGPTVASEPALAPIVYNITNNITGRYEHRCGAGRSPDVDGRRR